MRRQGGSKWEEKFLFQQNALPYSYLALEVQWDWARDEDEQDTNIRWTCSLRVVCAAGAPAEPQSSLQSTSGHARARCWEDTAESGKQRALTSKFHTPSNLCLGRESSAGNPPYVSLYYKELQSMSSFLLNILTLLENSPGWLMRNVTRKTRGLIQTEIEEQWPYWIKYQFRRGFLFPLLLTFWTLWGFCFVFKDSLCVFLLPSRAWILGEINIHGRFLKDVSYGGMECALRTKGL